MNRAIQKASFKNSISCGKYCTAVSGMKQQQVAKLFAIRKEIMPGTILVQSCVGPTMGVLSPGTGAASSTRATEEGAAEVGTAGNKGFR